MKPKAAAPKRRSSNPSPNSRKTKNRAQPVSAPPKPASFARGARLRRAGLRPVPLYPSPQSPPNRKLPRPYPAGGAFFGCHTPKAAGSAAH